MYYSQTYQSYVTQAGAQLALVVDAMAVSGGLFDSVLPIFRATVCVTTASGTCYEAGYVGSTSKTYFRAANRLGSTAPVPVGSILDFNASLFNSNNFLSEEIAVVRCGMPFHTSCGLAP